MADNVNITPGSGVAVTADECGDGSQAQVVKLAISANGDRTLIPATEAGGILATVAEVVSDVNVTANATDFKADVSGNPVQVFNKTGTALKSSAPVDDPVFVRLSDGTNPVAGLPVSGSVTAIQGAPAAVGNSWPTKVGDGANTAGITDVSGVKCLDVYDHGGSAANVLVDKAAFAEGTDKVAVVGGVYNPTRVGTVGDNHAAAFRSTAQGDVQASLTDSSGNEIGSTGNPLNVAVAATNTTPLPVTIATRGKTGIHKAMDLTASMGETTVWTPASGKKFTLTKLILAITTAGTVTVYDNTDGATTNVIYGTQQVGNREYNFAGDPFTSATANNVLRLKTGAGLVGALTVHGYEE